MSYCFKEEIAAGDLEEELSIMTDNLLTTNDFNPHLPVNIEEAFSKGYETEDEIEEYWKELARIEAEEVYSKIQNNEDLIDEESFIADIEQYLDFEDR